MTNKFTYFVNSSIWPCDKSGNTNYGGLTYQFNTNETKWLHIPDIYECIFLNDDI